MSAKKNSDSVANNKKRNLSSQDDVQQSVFSSDSWSDQVIEFEYQGKKHRELVNDKLFLKDMSVFEIKERLNCIPGKYAYWKSMQVDIEKEYDEIQKQFAEFEAESIEKVAIELDKRPSESALKNKAILKFQEKYRYFHKKLRECSYILGKISVITSSYDKQSWTLSHIASLTGREIGLSGGLDQILTKGNGKLTDF